MLNPYKTPEWRTAPISPTCEKMIKVICPARVERVLCGAPADAAYPVSGGGWCALCAMHALGMTPHVFQIESLIQNGEKFA